jgi:hypothetical protein
MDRRRSAGFTGTTPLTVMRRVPQPPMDKNARSTERRTAWPGLAIAVAGVLAGLAGFGRLTEVETVEGERAFESEIHLAFAHGGVEVAQPEMPSIPSGVGIPPWENPGFLPPPLPSPSQGPAEGPIRINLNATDPCPT